MKACSHSGDTVAAGGGLISPQMSPHSFGNAKLEQSEQLESESVEMS